MQNTKGPAEAEPELFSKNANGVRGLSWNAFGPSTGSGTLFIRFCSRLYAMTLHSLTAHEGESRGRARLRMTEPKGGYTEGVESTVYRGVLSEGGIAEAL